jgi:hypothetical protein
VTEGSDQQWREVAASNRERIGALERELQRVRDRQHEHATELAAIRLLAEQVKELGEHVRTLTQQMERVARRALWRPPATLVGQYLGLAIALLALVIAASH